MRPFRLILRTITHYPCSGLATAAGMAIATAVIIGALIVGDSLTRSLEKIVTYRLGNTTHTLTAGERLFTQSLANKLNESTSITTAPVLKSEAILTVQGSDLRFNNVQVWGVDSGFNQITGTQRYGGLKSGEILISDNLATRLRLKEGDDIILRMRTIGPIPPNTPFVSDEGQTIARRVRIVGIVGRSEGGHFTTETVQSTPFNVFADFGWLNRVMGLKNRCNLILMKTNHTVESLQKQVQTLVWPEDLGLELIEQENNKWLIRSERVFMDSLISSAIISQFPDAQPTLSYFANKIYFGINSTPYSFVNATNRFSQLVQGNILINQWMADDLQVSVGDSVDMEYFEVGLLRELQVRHARFRVQGVVSMQNAMPDKALIPHLPGLTDAGSCRDWNAGIPIDLEAIRQKDEDYWRDYQGTPKAWITLHDGQMMWENRFGNLTSLEIKTTATHEELAAHLGSALDPFQLEYMLRPVREEGITAARGGVDFSQLFAGMGVFIIAAGLMLTILLLQFTLLQRQSQWQLFSSLGFNRKLIFRIVYGEAFILVLVSTLLGAILSVFYSKAVFWGLNRLWYDMVRTEVLTLHFNPNLILTGMVISGIAAMCVVVLSLRKSIRQHSNPSLRTEALTTNSNKVNILKTTLRVLYGIATAILLFALFFNDIFYWFIAGIAVLIVLILRAYKSLFSPETNQTYDELSPGRLSKLNLRRNPVRSFSIVALLASGVFLILVLAANRKDMSIDPHKLSGGTGGFSYIAETTIPILRDLNHPDVKEEFHLPQEANIISFLSAYNDNASCHNLNRVANPRIIATQTELLEGRFRFLAKHDFLDTEQPWTSLSGILEDGVVPAVADQTVMQWGLGKQVGDTLTYSNAAGKILKLVLVGALNNTILQGNVIVDINHFKHHFPATDGATLFLIESKNDEALVTDDFNNTFRDHGWEMTRTNEKLAAFNSVENTYLSVFFLMGALGILLGTVGLAVVIAKTMIERRRETQLYQMLGFSKKLLFGLYFREYLILFAGGMTAGIIPALIASTPVFLAGFHNVSPWFLLVTLATLMLNGIGWIGVILYIRLFK